MDPVHYGQVKRLTMLRETALKQRSRGQTPPCRQPLGSPRARSFSGCGDNRVPEDDGESGDAVWSASSNTDMLEDPLIYPGIYAPSGFDMMNILVRVSNRPNPKICLGAIDASASLILCDLRTPDAAIVYSSDSFTALTGYGAADILGRNCRFLQSPDGRVSRGVERTHTDNDAVLELRNRVLAREEAQVTLLNYKKGGMPFVNVLTLIPIRWADGAAEAHFMVGFQVDRRDCFV